MNNMHKLQAQVNHNKLFNIEQAVRKWINMQDHNRCWYYPEIFQEIIEILEIEVTVSQFVGMNFINREEFEKGCKKYQDEIYKT